MADPPPPLALSTTSASPNPSATLWFWGARTGSPLAGSDPKGPTRCCGTAVQLGTISRRKLAGSPLRSLFVSVSDPCPALHIPNAGGTAALSPSTPISMTPKFQLPAYPILRPTTCQVPPQHPLHTPGPGSPQSPPPRNGMWSMAPPTPLGAPSPHLPVGAPVPPCSSVAESARPPPAARAPLRPPRSTPAPSPESLGPRERRRHAAPSRLQPLPNAAGSGPGTSQVSRLVTPFHRGVPASPPRVQRSLGWIRSLAYFLPSLSLPFLLFLPSFLSSRHGG